MRRPQTALCFFANREAGVFAAFRVHMSYNLTQRSSRDARAEHCTCDMCESSRTAKKSELCKLPKNVDSLLFVVFLHFFFPASCVSREPRKQARAQAPQPSRAAPRRVALSVTQTHESRRVAGLPSRLHHSCQAKAGEEGTARLVCTHLSPCLRAASVLRQKKSKRKQKLGNRDARVVPRNQNQARHAHSAFERKVREPFAWFCL